MITGKEKLFLILRVLRAATSIFYLKTLLKFTLKGKRYMELCHFVFSSTLSGTFRILINIYDRAIIANGFKPLIDFAKAPS